MSLYILGRCLVNPLRIWTGNQLPTWFGRPPNQRSAAVRTVVLDTSVFANQTEFRLPLGHDALVLSPQTGGVAGEDKGVSVQTGAVVVNLTARVVDGVVFVICVNHPVHVICTGGQEWNTHGRVKEHVDTQKSISLRQM